LNSFAPMPKWQLTARETSLAQVHEAPDPQFNISHTHSASPLLFHTREQFYSDVIMSSLTRRATPCPSSTPHNRFTPTRTPETRSNPNAFTEHRCRSSAACRASLRFLQRKPQPNYGSPFTNYKPQLATPPNNNVP
jgi:hypothetical protein